MEQTYNDILEGMKEKYREYSGEEISEVSDVGIRMRVLADEIFALKSHAEWLKRQMFFSTATGEWLEKHAAERGLTRISSQKATGRLAFSIANTLEYDFVIPVGTVCSTSDGELRYVTTEEGVIPSGSHIVQVLAQATQGGSVYNLPFNTINTVVTYFSVLTEVKNTSSFSGGTDEESDDAFRARLKEFCKNPSNGLNQSYYKKLAMQVEGVGSVFVKALTDDSDYNLLVIVADVGAIPKTSVVMAVQKLIEEYAPANIKPKIEPCELYNITLTVNVVCESGYSVDTVKSGVESAIKTYFNTLGVGDDIYIKKIGDVIFHVDGVKNYSFDEESDKDIAVNDSMLAVCGTLNLTVTEG